LDLQPVTTKSIALAIIRRPHEAKASTRRGAGRASGQLKVRSCIYTILRPSCLTLGSMMKSMVSHSMTRISRFRLFEWVMLLEEQRRRSNLCKTIGLQPALWERVMSKAVVTAFGVACLLVLLAPTMAAIAGGANP
jgi:hypothetical protein